MTEPGELDLSGLKCPLPVLYTRRALRALEAGRALSVICTDPLCGLDIPNLVREEGDRLEEAQHEQGRFRFLIRRAARAHAPGTPSQEERIVAPSDPRGAPRP